MSEHHVAVPMAMAIFAGTMISGAGPAQADEILYQHSCGFYLMAPDEEIDGPITIYATLTTSKSGASVLAHDIRIENSGAQEIIVDINRWESDDGTPPDQGPAEDIPGVIAGEGPGLAIWHSQTYISFEKDPSVYVHAYAKSRPEMKGGVICLASPGPGE
jgi:hypothetical protein